MPQTLADSLQLVLPHLPAGLAEPQAIGRLQTLAAALPPVPLGGFECRLDPDQPQVDLLQCIPAEAGVPALLAEHIRATALHAQPAWGRVREFCLRWADPALPLQTAVGDMWLEFDLDGAEAVPVPSVILTLNHREVPAAEALAAVELALPILRGRALSPGLAASLARCFHSLPEGAAVSHVGVMLSRPVEALRLNLQWLSPAATVAYLDAMGWPAPLADLETLLAGLFEQVDHVTVCLDVGERLYPRLGLECTAKEIEQRQPKMAALLTDWVARGLCAPAKRAALLAWPGVTSPNTLNEAWPPHLMARALAQPPDLFGVLERRLSHLKLVYQPGQPLEAKGYLGFGHLWVRPAEAAHGHALRIKTPRPMPVSNPPAPAGVERQALDSAMCAAGDFLLAARNPEGWWEDFRVSVGPSDEWVTAYVATLLSASGHAQAPAAAAQAWALLLARREAGDGWGYNAASPPDADSTGWGLRLAQAVGAEHSARAQAARQVLERHLRPDGGVVTYLEGSFTARPVESWGLPHICVTAAVAAVPGFETRARDYLCGAQLADGSWRAFWAYDHEYATALAAEALAQGTPEQRARVPQAVGWALNGLGAKGFVAYPGRPGGSPFATALSLRTLLLADDPAAVRPAVQRTLAWLLASQRADGGWSPSVRLRMPPHEVTDPEREARGMAILLDVKRLFTTATALAALTAVRQRWDAWALG